jgi:hypothetical protein
MRPRCRSSHALLLLSVSCGVTPGARHPAPLVAVVRPCPSAAAVAETGPTNPAGYPQLADLGQMQFCAFSPHGMMVQSLIEAVGDLHVGEVPPRSARWLVNLTCSFDNGTCMASILWVDQINQDGTYEKQYLLMADSEEKYTVVSPGAKLATIKTPSETWTVDGVTRKVRYVHSSSTLRGEGECVDRLPPLFRKLFAEANTR